MPHAIALTLLFAILSAPCQAAIYKWVDNKGVTHYTEQPPASGKSQEIQPRVTTPTTSAVPPAGQPAEKTDPTPPSSHQREAMTMPAERMAEQCQKARQRLQQLESSPRVFYRGADGQMIRAPEEERQRMIDEERKRIELYCE